MTIPMPGVRQPNFGGAGGGAMGPAYVQAKVISIDIAKNTALCKDSLSRMISVRLDVQRSKGQMPEVGEDWIIDKYYGIWTFAAILRGNTQGVVTGIENIPDLGPTLDDHQGQIDTNAGLMSKMMLKLTVTNVQSTNKRFVDGTFETGETITSVPCIGNYYPFVGDVCWVIKQGIPNDANNTPGYVALGEFAVNPGGNFGEGSMVKAQLIADSEVFIMADKRMRPPTSGSGGLHRGFIDAAGNNTYTSWIDTVQYGSDLAPLERNNVRNVGILWGNGIFYFTQGDGNGRVPVVMGNLTSTGIDSGNIRVGQINASGNIYTDGGVYPDGAVVTQGNIRSNGQLSCVGLFSSESTAVMQQLRVGVAEAPINGRITNREMTTEGNILVKGNIYCNGAYNPPSERSLKNHISELDDSLAVLRQLVAAKWTWVDQQGRDDKVHVGIYVDELAFADPDSVMTRGSQSDVPTSNPEVAQLMSEGRTYEDRAVLAHIVRAIQQLDKRVAALGKMSGS